MGWVDLRFETAYLEIADNRNHQHKYASKTPLSGGGSGRQQ